MERNDAESVLQAIRDADLLGLQESLTLEAILPESLDNFAHNNYRFLLHAFNSPTTKVRENIEWLLSQTVHPCSISG